MPRYLCLQRSLLVAETESTEKPSPTDMEKMYAQFNTWKDQFAANLPDMGGRLGAGRLVAGSDPTDGPFVEVKELVGGYMIVEADSLDQAVDVARGCPGLVRPGSGVEVIEIRTPEG